MKNGNLVGTAIETYSKKGFSGMIKLMVGLAPDGTIINISVLSHNETPGLGDKIDKKKSDFSLQFNGKNPSTFKLSVKKDRGDVDAITASTISSRAYCDAVQRAWDAYMKSRN
jgi:electron transport complex protein RnfG